MCLNFEKIPNFPNSIPNSAWFDSKSVVINIAQCQGAFFNFNAFGYVEMTKSTKNYLAMAGIALVVSSLVVWASNNVDAVEDVIGD
ncbi:hypothetical protein NBRC116587_38950 [Pseudoteredinibacter isoporae]